jgi:hypothetical protein
MATLSMSAAQAEPQKSTPSRASLINFMRDRLADKRGEIKLRMELQTTFS